MDGFFSGGSDKKGAEVDVLVLAGKDMVSSHPCSSFLFQLAVVMMLTRTFVIVSS